MKKYIYSIIVAIVITAATYFILLPYILNIQKERSLESRFELNKKEKGTQIYYSKKLGVGFTYKQMLGDAYNTQITESGNKINLGEWNSIEVFTKNASTTLGEAVTKDFLKGISSDRCFFEISKYLSEGLDAARYVQGTISYPFDETNGVPAFAQPHTCPPLYSATNAARYFLEDKTVPTKYLFVNGGQDSPFSDGSPWIDGSTYSWIRSLQVIE